MHYVYYLLDPDTRELLYIGRSNNPKRRLYAFIKKKKRNAILGICQRFSDFEKACKAELKAIATHWPPYNKNLISSKGKLGIYIGCGPTLSDAHKRKIGAASKGHVVTLEARQTIRRKLLGHQVSQTTRDRISAANKGRKMPPRTEAQRKASSERTLAFYQKKREQENTAHSFGGFAGGAIITKTRAGSTVEQY